MIQDNELYVLAIRSISKVMLTWRSSLRAGSGPARPHARPRSAWIAAGQADELVASAADRVRDGVQGGELAGLPWDCLDYDETVDPADDHRRVGARAASVGGRTRPGRR